MNDGRWEGITADDNHRRTGPGNDCDIIYDVFIKRGDELFRIIVINCFLWDGFAKVSYNNRYYLLIFLNSIFLNSSQYFILLTTVTVL